jgi:hypothetical protein
MLHSRTKEEVIISLFYPGLVRPLPVSDTLFFLHNRLTFSSHDCTSTTTTRMGDDDDWETQEIDVGGLTGM